MPRVKASKQKRVTKAVPALGAAGLTFSLVGARRQRLRRRMTNRRRQIIHRTIRSRSVKRKSPTSVWRHYMCSTKRARMRLATAYR